MFRRIVKTAWVGLALFYFMPAQASPIGFYVRGVGAGFAGEDSANPKKTSFLFSGLVGWQPHRFRAAEVSFALYSTLEDKVMDRGKKDMQFAFTFVNKDLIPLKYYLNVYTQWGCSVSPRNNYGLYAPFLGAGLTYYHTRRFHVDAFWRNYTLFKNFNNKGYADTRQNSIGLGLGYYVG